MGTLKTLGQILEYLSEGHVTESALVPESNDSELSSAGYQEIKNNMLEVVSRLTGYPAEMLSFDMDIEADLGIDSIKRVEILSALEEKMPELCLNCRPCPPKSWEPSKHSARSSNIYLKPESKTIPNKAYKKHPIYRQHRLPVQVKNHSV
jgi:hypothetical protein